MLGNQVWWVMLITCRQSGVTLIELLIGIVIAGILLMVGVNSFSMWMQNQQTRVATEAILNGMQVARVEAVKRNSTARFVLCGLPAASWEILAASAAAPQPATSTACGAGSNAAAGEERVQERSGQEGTKNASVTVTPSGATTVTFNGLGRVTTNFDGSAPITQVDVSNPKGDRPMRIAISTAGSLRMCDPSANLPAGDPRKC